MAEQRVVLRNCGVIDPANIDSWRAAGGFAALQRARAGQGPEEIIAWLKASGLRGRGGAGFPTGLKWDLTSKAAGTERYVICNADEGEVGTFKDRYVLEHDPFTLIEAIAIACYAVGARLAFIYLRDEYRDLLPQLRRGIATAQAACPLDCEIQVREAAGAYVCGEESGLMESIEGRRGEPRFKPPFPPSSGLWAKPTVIQNVETLMNVPAIIRNGPEWFAGIGTAQSKGTKVFAVSGDVARPCVCEVAMGTPLRDVVEGLAGAREVKMVQVGGASGRVVPRDRLDTPLAYEGVLGAGALTVFREGRDTIEIGLRTMEFFVDECCGKCSPCRQGCEALVEIMERLAQGRARAGDLTLLKDVAENMMLASLCGLGQAAPNFVVDTLQAFGDEYQARVLA